MECTAENWKDIDRYFRDTYVKVDGYGDTLFRIEHVNPQRISGMTQDQDYFEIELHNHQPFNLAYVLPHKAVFQYNKRAVLLQRIPAKQFKRGICSDNVSVSFTDSGAQLDLTLDVLKAYTTKQRYFSFNDAFRAKGNKQLSFALTPRMSCVKSTGAIYVDTVLVAAYKRETNTIQMINNKFKPEVLAVVEQHQDKMEVM